jgi:hypothetical protein
LTESASRAATPVRHRRANPLENTP